MGLLSLCIAVGTVHAESPIVKSDVATSAQSITAAATREERRDYVENLMVQYDQTERILLQNLHNACTQNKNNNTYYSPLHAVILAVSAWRIVRADDALIEVIDYTLDPASLPVGISVSGDFFYPAIRPLVRLRVDIRKVIEAIAQADNEKRETLLSWVLTERLGSDLDKAAEHLKAEIEKREEQKEKKNLSQAIERIGQAKHSSDLIPFPSSKEVGNMHSLNHIKQTGKLWGICEVTINDAAGTVTLVDAKYTGNGWGLTMYDSENKHVSQVTLKVNQHCRLSDGHHAFMKYVIKSIKDGIVEIAVTERFDARSFGKGVTEKTETISVKPYKDMDSAGAK